MKHLMSFHVHTRQVLREPTSRVWSLYNYAREQARSRHLRNTRFASRSPSSFFDQMLLDSNLSVISQRWASTSSMLRQHALAARERQARNTNGAAFRAKTASLEAHVHLHWQACSRASVLLASLRSSPLATVCALTRFANVHARPCVLLSHAECV